MTEPCRCHRLVFTEGLFLCVLCGAVWPLQQAPGPTRHADTRG